LADPCTLMFLTCLTTVLAPTFNSKSPSCVTRAFHTTVQRLVRRRAYGDPIIAYVRFVDGTRRPVDLEASVLGCDGEKVHGVWYLPPEERIGPDAVVDADFF